MIYDLHLELITKLAEHVEFYEDFETFGKVCTCWRRAMKRANRSAASRQTPWLMLQPESGNIYSKELLYSFYSRKISKLDLPTPEDDPYGMWQYIVSSCRGWLVCVNDMGAMNIVISLVHPISKEAIRTPELPSDLTWKLKDYEDFECYVRSYLSFALSESPSNTSHYLLACFFEAEDSEDVNTVAIWNSKESYWVVKELSGDDTRTRVTVTFHKGEFYICDERSKTIVGFVVNNNAISTRVLLVKPPWEEDKDRGKIYLVASGDALVLVRCKRPNPSCYGTYNFRMWEVNTDNGNTKEVNSLGNKALFLSRKSSFFVEASSDDRGCKANCIYYVGDCVYESDKFMGVYDYNSTSGRKIQDYISPSHLRATYARNAPAMWVETPSRFPYT